MTGDRRPDFDAGDTKADQALELVTVAAAAVPWLGGPLSAVLSGAAFDRKIGRVRDVVNGLVADLRDFKSEASERYVRTEEFEDLLDAALRRAAEERNEQRRKLFQRFIVNSIRQQEPFDDRLRVLRALSDLTLDHIRVLQAIGATPPNEPARSLGSPFQTISDRLGRKMPRETLDDVVADLHS